MASVDLRRELDCSICLNIYTDPVMLICGHNYCQVCIDPVLDTQGGSGGYFCPECRTEFQDRPALYRNITLCNIVQSFLSTQPEGEKSKVFCTHCVDSPVPAVKSCLHCEASMCVKHLKVHSKSPEHVLCDPTTSMEIRKCSIHKEILEFYCSEDGVCICLACKLDGTHRGHQVKMLAAASEMKKDNLKTIQQNLMTKNKEADKRIHRLKEHKKKVEEKVEMEKKEITVLLGNLRRRVEDLEKRVLGELSGKAERVSRSVNYLIRQLEMKKDELSTKMRHIEELCNKTDPLTVLQESDTGDLGDTEDGDDKDRDKYDKLFHDGGDLHLDLGGISRSLHTDLSDIMTGVKERMEEAEDIVLDVNTAGSKLQISDDGKTVTAFPSPDLSLPDTPKRFKFSLVMSSQRFSSGRHTWEVDTLGSNKCDFGMCYSSVDRGWNTEVFSQIGNADPKLCNSKYWCSQMINGFCYMVNDTRKQLQLCMLSLSRRIRIYLDYEAGRISFYAVTVPIQHLYTFTTTFTEPLHVVIGVWEDYGCVKICGGKVINDQK